MLHVVIKCDSATIVRFRTACRADSSCGTSAFRMISWNGISRSPKRDNRSERMSSASSCTDTSFDLIASESLPVMRWHTLGTSETEFCGKSEMTVLRPMLEMSRSCSLLLIMLPQSVSTMVSTCTSFTLLTRGPRLKELKHCRNCKLKFRNSHSPLHSKILNFSILVFEQSQDSLHHFLLRLIVELDAVLLQLAHQIICGHETKIFVVGCHLEERTKGEGVIVWLADRQWIKVNGDEDDFTMKKRRKSACNRLRDSSKWECSRSAGNFNAISQNFIEMICKIFSHSIQTIETIVGEFFFFHRKSHLFQ